MAWFGSLDHSPTCARSGLKWNKCHRNPITSSSYSYIVIVIYCDSIVVTVNIWRDKNGKGIFGKPKYLSQQINTKCWCTFKLQVVTGGMSRLSCSPPPWATCLNPQNFMKTACCWGLVLLKKKRLYALSYSFSTGHKDFILSTQFPYSSPSVEMTFQKSLQ